MSSVRAQKGYVLITTALLLAAIVGISGLSFDLGRMYIARNEAQAFADAAALAGAKALNGTTDGLTTAREAALSVAKMHNFGTQAFAGTDVTFSATQAGPWEAVPLSGAGIRFARVIATAPTNVYLLSIAGTATTSNPAALAIAGQVVQTRFTSGLFPMSPFIINTTAPHYGMVPCTTVENCEGSYYALRWPPGQLTNQIPMTQNGNSLTGNVCPGDYNQASVTSAQTAEASIRGFYDPFNNANDQRAMIVNDIVASPLDISVGTDLPMTSGNMQTQADAIAERVNQDTDPTSRTYQAYLRRLDYNGNRVGNGRRVVGAPLNAGPPNFEVVGVAGFFLLTADWYNVNGNQPLCAEYIGSFTLGAASGGGGGSGSYVVRLVQ